MILLDTSIPIDYFRAKDAGLLSRFESENAAICGITRAEILYGARSPVHRESLIAALDVLNQVMMPESLWDHVGDILSKLRGQGITVPFTDAVIAGVAMGNGLALWTRDKQFALINHAFPQLVLFDETA